MATCQPSELSRPREILTVRPIPLWLSFDLTGGLEFEEIRRYQNWKAVGCFTCRNIVSGAIPRNPNEMTEKVSKVLVTLPRVDGSLPRGAHPVLPVCSDESLSAYGMGATMIAARE
jgi:hypothetical protein